MIAMTFKLVFSLFVIIFIAKSDGQSYCQNPDIKTCGECISTSYRCFWCADHPLKPGSGSSRCNSEEHWKRSKCVDIVGDRVSNAYVVKENKQFSDKMDETVQLRPQKIDISLRADSYVEVPIEYKQAQDYPMDLYYLMDLSCTMLRHKDQLAEVGERLAKAMKEATRNFRIGFGSYVDKPLMPYSSFDIKPIDCSSGTLKVKGEPPYSFKHRLSLTSDENDFVRKVSATPTSGNTDSPEGLLDALMQVLVCNKHIGWRSQSDKIIVVATDEEFHYAGDGRLAGIITPNDGLCHMSDDGNYTHYHLLDYPSMHQIAEKGNRFNIMFTVAKNVMKTYEILAKIIGSTARVSLLNDGGDDNSLVKLIKDVYSNIRSSVELKVERYSDNIQVELYSNCLNKGSRPELRSTCEYRSNKDTIAFKARIKLKSCPQSGPNNAKIRIGLANNADENVEINLNMLCGCDCEKSVEPSSRYCSGHGDFSCGICKCHGIRSGADCSCDPEKPINPKDPFENCRSPNSTSTCSNRGKCECGSCSDCEEGYSGKFCEVDESDCYPNNDKTQIKCNGKGLCSEAKCVCSYGFTGKSCECPTSNSTCIEEGSDQVCSGRGECKCGKCNCNTSKATGHFCQFCPSCEDQKYCNQTFECVPEVCEVLYGSRDNCSESCDFEHTLVDILSDQNSTSTSVPFRHQCHQRTLDGNCDISFIYERTDELNRKIFRITKPVKSCKEAVNLVVVSGSVAAGVLLVGLALLLIWKLITELWDRQEYARFQKELSKVNWEQSENPLYKEAKSTFTNPMFGNLRERATKRLSRITERFSRRFDVN